MLTTGSPSSAVQKDRTWAGQQYGKELQEIPQKWTDLMPGLNTTAASEEITFMTMLSDSEQICKISRNLVVSIQGQNISNKLAESFIINSGATIHVCNDFDRFYDYHEMDDNSRVRIWDTFTRRLRAGQDTCDTH
jgi:hypothetical protein